MSALFHDTDVLVAGSAGGGDANITTNSNANSNANGNLAMNQPPLPPAQGHDATHLTVESMVDETSSLIIPNSLDDDDGTNLLFLYPPPHEEPDHAYDTAAAAVALATSTSIVQQQQQQQQQQQMDSTTITGRLNGDATGSTDERPLRVPVSDPPDQLSMGEQEPLGGAQQHHHPQQRLLQPLPTQTPSLERSCRICGQAINDGRPVVRFLPVVAYPGGEPVTTNPAAAAAATGSFGMMMASMIPTLALDICMHVFCGKTAGILPTVNQPELEILTKAGIKNKHGIGQDVNAALSRTRCAIYLPDQVNHPTTTLTSTSSNSSAKSSQSKEKQFYLVREFEAHLSMVRHTSQQRQQQEGHAAPAPPPLPPTRHHALPPPAVPAPSPLAPLTLETKHLSPAPVTIEVAEAAVEAAAPSFESGHETTAAAAATAPVGTTSPSFIGMDLRGLLIPPASSSQPSPTLHSTVPSNLASADDAALQSMYGTSLLGGHLLDQSSPNFLTSVVDPFTAAVSSTFALEQLEAMILMQQQQQFQQQFTNSSSNAYATSYFDGLLLNHTTDAAAMSHNVLAPAPDPVAPAASASNGGGIYPKTVPVKAAAGRPPGADSDKIQCECGGTYLAPNGTKGVTSWRNHVSTKRHKKFAEQRQQEQSNEYATEAELNDGTFADNSEVTSADENDSIAFTGEAV